jgi:hypothetical protein
MITSVLPTAIKMMTAGPDSKPWILDELAKDVFLIDVAAKTTMSANKMANSRNRTSFRINGVLGAAAPIDSVGATSSRFWLTM